MVYTKVSIYRGYLVDQKSRTTILNSEYDDSDESNEEENKYQDIMNLASVEGIYDPIEAVLVSGCCSKNTDSIVGCKIAEYNRKKFEWDENNLPNRSVVEKLMVWRKEHYGRRNNYHCGSEYSEVVLSPNNTDQLTATVVTNDDIESKCGYSIVCDRCIGMTTNGFYPVEDILTKTVECTTYCFKCNQDKCKIHQQPYEGDYIFTTDKAIDHLLNNFYNYYNEVEGVTLPSIKNYYILDDCLSCT
jgi:hypothetical protein